MNWEEHFDDIEDESGKHSYPVWWVVNISDWSEAAGPFDSEGAAIDAAGELVLNNPCP